MVIAFGTLATSKGGDRQAHASFVSLFSSGLTVIRGAHLQPGLHIYDFSKYRAIDVLFHRSSAGGEWF